MSIQLNVGLIEVEVEEIKFSVRPEHILDSAKAMQFGTGVEGQVDLSSVGLFSLVNRIVGWGKEIVDQHGKPLTCNRSNVAFLFKQRPDLIEKLAAAIAEKDEADSKNLKTSHAG